MSISIRSASLVFAALSASSVAPAQVGATSEPLMALNSPSLPKAVVPEALPKPVEPLVDAVQPADLIEQTDAEPVNPTGDLSSMVAQLRSSNPGSRELECLAVGIYFEAKSEPLVGQLAVGEVIANRANSKGRFPSSYCGVLFQRSQFSFIRGKALPSVPRASRQWQTAVAVAKIVDQDLKDSAADKALFFHARRVSPGWKLKRVASIGNHIFYR
jgi:spore germination cell wall hydrolase CwlJ-like protein